MAGWVGGDNLLTGGRKGPVGRAQAGFNGGELGEGQGIGR